MLPSPPKQDLTRILFAVLVIGLLTATSIWILRPFLPPLVWATMIVVSTWPMLRAVQARLGGRRSLAVAVMTTGMLLVIAIPVGYGVDALVEFVPQIGGRVGNLSSMRLPQPPEWLAGVPLVGERASAAWHEAIAGGPGPLLARVTPYLQTIGAWILAEAGGVGMFVVQLLMTLLLTAILYATGETAAAGVRRFAHRLAGERGVNVVTLAGQSIRAVALGIIVTALVQSVLGGLGLAVAGVPYAGLLTAVMFVFCIAQVGPLPVLLAAVGWLWWTDAVAATVGLAVWTAVVGSLDNVLRPMLIRRGADLPLLLIMAGVIGGLVAFGLIGLFVGPVVLAVSYRLVQAWIEDDPSAASGDAQPGANPGAAPPAGGGGAR